MQERVILFALRQLFNRPSRESYLELAQAVVASPQYDPDSLAVNSVDEFLEEGEIEKALNRFTAIANHWIASPRMHTLAGVALEQYGDNEKARFELKMATALTTGILSTGDGSVLNPYVVTRVSDEYDVLGYRLTVNGELEPTSRVSVERQLQRMGDGRWMDQHRLSDGSSVWFDVSMMMSHPGEKGVLRSGDGREESPFQITSLRLEYELPRYLLKDAPQEKELVTRDDRYYDVQRFANGSELWYDVTGFHRRPTS